HFCKSRSCSDLENGKDSFKLWTISLCLRWLS
ncbi:LOW QUALITY PROTEIN: ODF4 isoform 4, partial [Pongo abelii]